MLSISNLLLMIKKLVRLLVVIPTNMSFFFFSGKSRISLNLMGTCIDHLQYMSFSHQVLVLLLYSLDQPKNKDQNGRNTALTATKKKLKNSARGR